MVRDGEFAVIYPCYAIGYCECMFHKHRLEALSDAVFAIVMTLLVLDLKAPVHLPPGELAGALLQDRNAWFSFAMTFCIAAIFWTLQHHVFDVIKDAGQESLVLTFVFLGAITLLPFTTSLIGQQSIERLTFMLYFLNLFLAAVALMLKMEVASVRGRLVEGVDTRMLRFRLYRVSFVMLAGALGARFLPLKFFYVGPLSAVLIARALQAVVHRRLRASDALIQTS